MSVRHAGRHRAPGYSPLTEIADIASRSAQPAMKASAVAVASGGLIASFAIPASASSASQASAASSSVAAAPAAAPALAVAAPKVTAAKTPAFGQVGFTATAAPAAAPATVKITKIKKATPAPATTTTRASRSTTRTAPAAPSTTAAAAPAVQEAAPAAAPAPTGGIVGIAASLSGIPYVYGGTTTRGFDCSGFTGYVYRQAGISLPRTAAAQQSFATRVSNPAPGDLVFFGFPAYHVGIYAGPGQLYDAQHPGTTTGLHSIWTSTNVSYGRVG